MNNSRRRIVRMAFVLFLSCDYYCSSAEGVDAAPGVVVDDSLSLYCIN
jgi:hypothetical protein